MLGPAAPARGLRSDLQGNGVIPDARFVLSRDRLRVRACLLVLREGLRQVAARGTTDYGLRHCRTCIAGPVCLPDLRAPPSGEIPMTSIGVLQIAIFFGLILACTKPLGAYMAKVFEGQRTFMHPVLRRLEALTYKLIGVKEEVE